MALAQEHIDDLRASTLTDETIAAARLQGCEPRKLLKIGQRFNKVVSAVEFRYFHPDGSPNGFYRLKLFPPVDDGNGHLIRYWQEPGTSPHIYFPPQVHWHDVFPDPKRPVVVTEGEKKALALAQIGLAALGIGGLWNWMVKHEHRRFVSPELELLVWQGRSVELCPDNDVWDREELLRAVFALGMQLTRRGANVQVVRIRS
jgi:hypothetical protein